MGLLQSYGLFLHKSPGKIILAGVCFVLLLFSLTLYLRPIPNFKDPLVGFEARGTVIANRLNTFKLLMDETTASANNLSLQANSDLYEYAKDSGFMKLESSSDDLNSFAIESISSKLDEVPIVLEMSSTQLVGRNNNITNGMLDEGEEEYYRSVNTSQEFRTPLIHYSLGSSRAFCGKLSEDYAQVVISPSAKSANIGLFNLNSMIAICHLDSLLRLEQANSAEDSAMFQEDCERFKSGGDGDLSCCNSFSLPNYVACLSNKTTCMDLKVHDIALMEQLLSSCAPYYFRSPYEKCFSDKLGESETHKVANKNLPSSLGILSEDHLDGPRCTPIPDKCLRCNGWTYAVMHYLISDNFVQNRTTSSSSHKPARHKHKKHQQPQANNKESIVNKLVYTNIFLPLAKSTSLMKYYQTLASYNLKTPYAQVRAMDLGLKNSLFELLISQDAKLFIIALILILTVISIYTWSFLISTVILMIICLSLCLSYSIYELVLNIPIFPFMNLLAVVISFGICSDNAMLFCKHWSHRDSPEAQASNGTKNNSNEVGAVSTQRECVNSEQANIDRVLKRAVVSTLIATLATACSFIISALSGVVAVRCFCIYATLSVVTNYLLIVLLLPPALIIDSRFSQFASEILINKGPRIASLLNSVRSTRESLLVFGHFIHGVTILNFVTKYKLYLIITFMCLLACSSVLVFHEPRLSPADEDDIQLLSSRHTFEQYDKSLKRQFAFERPQLSLATATDYVPGESSFSIHDDASSPETLPIRVVFGVKPIDTGNHFDPQDRGKLLFDSAFDISEPSAQVWLLEFCDNLRKQKFVHQSATERMSSCFMYTFKSWMKERSCRDPVLGDDLSPCCRSYEFPYARSVFNRCIQEALKMFHNTPNYAKNPGIYFFKNSTKVAAIVIEYKSTRPFTESYTKMDRFYSDVDEWVRLQINNTAPRGLRSGWFVSSNLDLLALQEELAQSTSFSILLEVLFAMLALMIGTRDVVLTLVGSLTIVAIITSSVAALILFRWTLGVAESILVSLTIGLSIDFALHYSVAFSERRRKASIEGIIHAILDEVGSPIALATITTSLAGFVIIWSDILAYQELGVFLMLIALISWASSTFFLLPMLATFSSIMEYGQLYCQAIVRATIGSVGRFLM